MENVRNFIDQVAQGDNIAARETLDNLLSARAFESLESKKQEIGSTLFGGIEEEVEQIDEKWDDHWEVKKASRDEVGNTMHDIHHKGKYVGSVTKNKHGSWSTWHEPAGGGDDNFDSKHDAINTLKRDHKEYTKDKRELGYKARAEWKKNH